MTLFYNLSPIRRFRILLKVPHVDLRGFVVIVGILVVWQIAAIMIPSPFIPTLQDIVRSAYFLTVSGDLWLLVEASVGRVLVGFVFGTTAGFIMGVLLGVSLWARRLSDSGLTLIRHIPIFGLIPLVTLWFGTQDLSKIVLIGVASFFPMMLQTQEGIRTVPAKYLELASALTFTPAQTFFRVLLPSALPFVLTGVRHSIAFAWISGVGGELFMNTGAGLGSLLTAARIEMRMDYILIGISVVALIGYAMTRIAAATEKCIITWPAPR
jgi:sulfonate transport system permease protein